MSFMCGELKTVLHSVSLESVTLFLLLFLGLDDFKSINVNADSGAPIHISSFMVLYFKEKSVYSKGEGN